MKRQLVLAVLGVMIGSSALADPAPGHIDWNYDGDHGPKHWAELAPDFGECARGKAQSPINISHATPRADLPDLDVHYHTAPLRILNNGHTVQVNAPDDDTLSVGDHRYHLAQFHFHTPSEEHLDGKTYAMELHMVHRDDEGHLAVLGVMIRNGKRNPALDHVLSHLPKDADGDHDVDDAVDPASLLPKDLSYFYYEGSLTTPPCAEHVAWYVLEHPIQASKQQIASFKKLYSHNARPIQPLNARTVYAHRAHAPAHP